MDYFNAALSMESDESITQTLQMATQLHFSFVSCNNASTEHLSVLHLCYDLSAVLLTRLMRGDNPDATARAKVQLGFWTEQLKRAHMIRYGSLGEELEHVRGVMKHSKLILRDPRGWFLAGDKFI